MTSFVNRLFTVSSFESDFPLVLDVDGEKGKKIMMPEGIRYEKQMQQRLSLHLSHCVSRLGPINSSFEMEFCFCLSA